MLRSLQSALRNLPMPGLFRARRRVAVPARASAAEIFTDIYERNGWRGKESVSGTGSDPEQTRRLIAVLPELFRDFGIRSILDAPCGDFSWMRHVDLGNIAYLGGDIVDDLIVRNQAHAREGVAFRRIDLLNDVLPAVDLILCRDCLVHFSFEYIFQALANLCASNATYLLTTTFPLWRRNRVIQTGQFRPLNLELAPFRLPPPLRRLEEGCTEARGRYADKSLGLWRIADIRKSLNASA
ncbi:MAG: class I SAM-dependent methyltransferase [Planctomycetes bacterium]|nr:class I SAM-dependent methyltransferase [Planctomycetota bacterium]